ANPIVFNSYFMYNRIKTGKISTLMCSEGFYVQILHKIDLCTDGHRDAAEQPARGNCGGL
ncbi:MAG: hypothetical protein IJ941_01145, partial [Clostridia bacterium]|nr:hypothetical protein [Clostridia bacterium]